MSGKTGFPFRFIAALQTLEFGLDSTFETLMLAQIFIRFVLSTTLTNVLLTKHFVDRSILNYKIRNRFSRRVQDDIIGI